jgi:hypothetical protein
MPLQGASIEYIHTQRKQSSVTRTLCDQEEQERNFAFWRRFTQLPPQAAHNQPLDNALVHKRAGGPDSMQHRLVHKSRQQ